jgi:signal transduction histidine kinase/CheY-like chemotaxis protein
MRNSVSQRFLLGLGLTSLAFTVVTSLAAFGVFQQELEKRQIQFLSQYVQERTNNVDRRFSNLMTLQRSAADALTAEMDRITPETAKTLVENQTRLLPDGTRRSRPEAFDGYSDHEGGRVYGVGSFLGNARALTPLDLKMIAAAFPIVSRFGQAEHGDYDNLYFFAPQTRLVMFGPDRPDRLLFYREKAPADLDISKDEMSRFIQPNADPTGETRCTSLQHLVQDTKESQRVATACVTPVYYKGRFIGAFGSSIKLDDFLNGVVGEGLAGADTLIVRADGQLIAAPHAPLTATRTEGAVADYEGKLGLTALARRLSDQGPFGITRSQNGKDIVAHGRLKGPGWYLLITYPAAAVAWSAARSASWILLLGFLGAALQTAMLLRLARSAIVRPLETLAESCKSRDNTGLNELATRTDEIGLLARSLSAERARSDELMSSMEQRIQERTAELEHANAEKSRFLANMSHELRTPLNGVIALSENLAKEQTTPRNVELAELIVASGRLLEKVLTDILDFSKIEAGEMRIERHPFDLQTTVSRVAELHRASAEVKGIQLLWRLGEGVEGAYLGDSVRLTQVLSNLLSNAVKFTEAGEVVLSVRRDVAGVTFSVRDNGIGFDESVRVRLFQRFEQADVSIRRRFGGTGLGLAICRSLVELMGGDIRADSAPGVGSTFSFTLPLMRDEQASLGEVEEEEEEILSLEGVRILLAEDHPTNQKVIQLILDTVGTELTIVENGRLALDALERESFDVVLMDMQMPELDGLSATILLREREVAEGLARTPVIMLTANAMDEHVAASLAAGADLHISKPVRAAELLGAISAMAFSASIGEEGEGDDVIAAAG